jgi:hypothetical protein
MSSGIDIGWRSLETGVLLIVCGVISLRRPAATAERNREFIDSGKETYFEQRRAWKAYPWTRPSTDARKVKRIGWLLIVVGSALLILGSSISYWSK